jgi:hypothetical protein
MPLTEPDLWISHIRLFDSSHIQSPKGQSFDLGVFHFSDSPVAIPVGHCRRIASASTFGGQVFFSRPIQQSALANQAIVAISISVLFISSGIFSA